MSKKGEFERSRSKRQEELELEQAFRQVTQAANGRSGADMPDQGTPGSGPVVYPLNKVNGNVKKTSGSRKAVPQYNDDAPSQSIRQNRKIAVISLSVVAAVLVVCVAIGVWFYFSSTADNGLILSNVYAAGINLGGMTPEEATVALQNTAAGTLLKKDLVITLPDTTLTLSPKDTGVALDVERLVADAYQHGRSGSRRERIAAQSEAKLSTYTIGLLPYLTLDTAYIQDEVKALHDRTSSTLTQPSVQVEGTRPTAAVPEEIEGTDPTEKVYQTLTITLGTQERSFDADQVYNQVLDAYNLNDLDGIMVEYSIIEPEEPDLQALIKEYCTEPVNAKLDTTDYSITEEVWGYGFNQTAAQNLLNAAQYGEKISLPLTYQRPSVIKSDLEATLFKDILAEADTPYYWNSPRTTNLVLACQAVNGFVVKPGETFSFNDVLGERTSAKGYQAAGAYVNGETVDQVGGGICQVASTIYYCALYADLEIVERYEHMYSADYVPLGMDATINWGTLDFKFRNNTDYPIRIEAEASDGYVHVGLLGTDDKNYYVVMDYEVIEELQWKTVEKVMEENNPDGYKDGDVIRSPYMGYIVDTYKYKYDKATDQLISCTFEAHSEYDKRDKLVCKINKPTEPPTTPPTTETEPEPSTEPPEEPSGNAEG